MAKGFTLLEVLFSLTVMVLAIFGVFSLLNQIALFSPLTGQRLIASYLAQEGMEIVRNLRDNNKLQGANWSQGLDSCQAGCEADYLSQSLTSWTGTGRYLKNNGSFYNYAVGSDTPFKRKITITPEGSDLLKVNVEVFWSEKGRDHSLALRENLYNW